MNNIHIILFFDEFINFKLILQFKLVTIYNNFKTTFVLSKFFTTSKTSP